MIYGYIRVSTDRQDLRNQRRCIDIKADNLGIKIEKYINDKGVSGVKEPEERALGGCLKKLQKGDIIICSELSRLGRKLFMIMRILEYCMRCGAKIYTVKDNYELGDNIQSKVLAFAFGISAEIERDLISRRTKEALARKKSEGIKLGRKFGSKNKNNKLEGKENIIKKMILENKSKTFMAKKLNVSQPTLRKFLRNYIFMDCHEA